MIEVRILQVGLYDAAIPEMASFFALPRKGDEICFVPNPDKASPLGRRPRRQRGERWRMVESTHWMPNENGMWEPTLIVSKAEEEK